MIYDEYIENLIKLKYISDVRRAPQERDRERETYYTIKRKIHYKLTN